MARTLIAAVTIAVGPYAQAQGLDASHARATIGQPLQLQLRLRDPDAAVGLPLRDCVRVEIRQGDEQAATLTLALTQSTREPDGALRLTLSHAALVREPLLFGRATWLCGAHFVREFTLLAEPPGDPSGPMGTPTPVTTWPVAPPAVVRATTAAVPTVEATAPPLAPPIASSPLLAPIGPVAPPSRTARAPRRVASDAALPTASPSPVTARSAAAPRHANTPAPAVAAPAPQPPPASPSPAAEARPQIWQQDLAALREEQRLSRELLTRLGDRLAQTERESARATWVAVALGLGWVGTVLAPRLAATRRTRSRDTTTATFDPVEALTDRATPADTPGPTAQPTHAPDSAWPDADPSQAVLDEWRHLDLLHKIDRLGADGYLGASVTVLENARQGRVGKSPGVLLRLLDRYGQLGQAGNRERVASELGAIYNVQVPLPMGSDEGPSLDTDGDLWAAIVEAWPTERACTVLSGALQRSGSQAPLSLTAFREAVWLHGLAALRESLGPAEPPTLTVQSLAEWAQPIDVPDTPSVAPSMAAPVTASPPSPWALAPL